MKIAHCIASIDKNAGGTTTAVYDILKAECHYMELELYTLKTEDPISLEDIGNLVFFLAYPTFLDYSVSLNKMLMRSEADLFHGHAVWNLPMHQMAEIARKRKKIYILSIHGMLESWSLQQSKWKKKLALTLYQHKDLKKAACLHATATSEAKAIRALGYTNPIAVIPNGISTEEYPLKEYPENQQSRKILFLSRIHPKKGIEILIESWKKIPVYLKKDWHIEIVGNGDVDYVQRLKDLIKQENLQDTIHITGPRFGIEKIKTYHSADLFVLPTYSENFGMVIAEALSCGVPVITTKGAPWWDLEEKKCGQWIDVGVEYLVMALEEMMQKTDEERAAMGRVGRQLVEEKYSINSVSLKFVQLYGWLLNKNEKPDFVV